MDFMAVERTGDERRSVRAALYEGVRAREESLTQYVARREQQYLKASIHGMAMLSRICGQMLEEGAQLSKQGMQPRWPMMTSGSTWALS